MSGKVVKGELRFLEKCRITKKATLGVFGSRTLDTPEVADILLAEIEKYQIQMIVTAGEIKGVSEVVRRICKAKAIPLLLFFPNEARARGQYHWRSISIIGHSDRMVVIWDGESKGTKGELELLKQLRIPYNLYHAKPSEDSVFGGGLLDDKEWVR